MLVSIKNAKHFCLVTLSLCLITFLNSRSAELPQAKSDSVQSRGVQLIQDAYGANPTIEAFREYPIGLFDSGTGGLTVLEQILELDDFDNQKKQHKRGGDGKPDFARESFIFLADQANMPYGNYPSVNREKFLQQLIVKDAKFLMGRRFFNSPNALKAENSKPPVKAIVIACNTATAYGKDDIQQLIFRAGLDIKVIGVIDAGARGSLTLLKDGKPATIGVVPTRGTVLSQAYPRAIQANAKRQGFKQPIQVVQQGAVGLAASIDGDSDFIDRSVRGNQPRKKYKGPSLNNPIAKIDLAILPRYEFDFSENQMLYDGAKTKPTALQINSVENYIAYHLVTLLETLRASYEPKPLRSIILGCTHFPFYQDTFRQRLLQLYNFQENGKYIYREIMAKKVELIDPAYFTARELYQSLADDAKFRDSQSGSNETSRGKFYISMPYRNFDGVKLNESGGFTYDYKYNRKVGHPDGDYRCVPLIPSVLSSDASERLESRVPAVWKLLREFSEEDQLHPRR